MQFWTRIFLNKPFFFAILTVIASFVIGFFYPPMIMISKLLLLIILFVTLIDWVLLFSNKKGISGNREVNEKLSNSDVNQVVLRIRNHFSFRIKYTLLDEIPEQFQIFDFQMNGLLSPGKQQELKYELMPKERGNCQFGKTNVFVETPLRLLQRRIILDTEKTVRVYPSFLRLNKYSLGSFRASINEMGQKNIRRIGHSMEFEQIKKYVVGDDYRTVNWKSTAKHQSLMVNQYVDEKSQQIYCAIDKGRMMKMPFEGMSLLDYSINAALIFSNIVLQNQDRAGVFTFSKELEDMVKAERRTAQLQKIMESLYAVKTDFMESDFGKLYNTLRYKVTQRSLIILFTNFDSMDALHRQLPYLLGIRKSHLLVLVFFKNTELEDFVENHNNVDPYQIALAEKFIYEKQQIVLELSKNGIQTVLTRPEDLSINTINKYLEIKSRGMI